MKNFLIESKLDDGQIRAVEYLDRQAAIRVANRTWRRGHVAQISVRDADGDIVWARGAASKVGGKFL